MRQLAYEQGEDYSDTGIAYPFIRINLAMAMNSHSSSSGSGLGRYVGVNAQWCLPDDEGNLMP
ncbi:hypothetical protein I633_22926 (plasmid) [Alteromonas mediterranea 615]|uniref:Uncharacterized protein n=1 Tax=Alteromonas mediterranea 615 TaxID=1300253 RepID=S5ASX1_9ALTE|nr:hypothetical protein I633_22926 [Alteromonas mediterranea 615]